MEQFLHRFFDDSPATWQDLESMVAQSFAEMGYETHAPHHLHTVRGSVQVDVHAVKTTTPIPTVVLCECKYWNKPVDQNVVHSFRTICSDVGAHFGLIISKIGFQSGAHETRKSTNIHLLNFEEFQETFFEDWRTGIFLKFAKMSDVLRPLLPLNPAHSENTALQAKLSGVNVFQKYEVFFGERSFASYFVGGGGQFPISIADPRGTPKEGSLIAITSYRQYYEVSAAACADAQRYFDL